MRMPTCLTAQPGSRLFMHIHPYVNDAEFKALLDVRYAFILHTMLEYDAAYQPAGDILMEISNDGNP